MKSPHNKTGSLYRKKGRKEVRIVKSNTKCDRKFQQPMSFGNVMHQGEQ